MVSSKKLWCGTKEKNHQQSDGLFLEQQPATPCNKFLGKSVCLCTDPRMSGIGLDPRKSSPFFLWVVLNK
jgi:hypothetical protein